MKERGKEKCLLQEQLKKDPYECTCTFSTDTIISSGEQSKSTKNNNKINDTSNSKRKLQRQIA